MIEWINELSSLGIGFESLQESITITTLTGQLTFHIFGALAEFERNLIRERTKAGLAAARARGRLGGRPKQLETSKRKLAVYVFGGDFYFGIKGTLPLWRDIFIY